MEASTQISYWTPAGLHKMKNVDGNLCWKGKREVGTFTCDLGMRECPMSFLV